MIRTALYFGIWTIACMVVAIGGFFVISDVIDSGLSPNGVFSSDNPSWRAAGFLAMFSPVAGIVAGLLWFLFHRNGRKPGWLLYGLLALLVVLVSHMLVFGGMFTIGSDNFLRDFVGAILSFVIHGWLSVPVAFAGTALFVMWNRRRAAAAA